MLIRNGFCCSRSRRPPLCAGQICGQLVVVGKAINKDLRGTLGHAKRHCDTDGDALATKVLSTRAMRVALVVRLPRPFSLEAGRAQGVESKILTLNDVS